jgi:tetratricopeptide (TPR) repeat protein
MVPGMRVISLCLASLLMVAPGTASADALEQAAQAYKDGVAAFKAEEFPTALGLFERAYKLDPSPILIYNLARTHEEMGHASEAIDHFELYLTRVPGAADRADVERRVRVMKKILEQVKPEPEPEPVEPSPPPTRAPASPPLSSLRPYAYSAFGLSAAALGAGVFYWVQLGAAESDHDSAATGDAKVRTAGEADDAALGLNIAFSVAGAAAAAGAVLWFMEPDMQVAPSVAAGPDGGFVGLTGRF